MSAPVSTRKSVRPAPLAEIIDITKSFGDHQVLSGISFTVQPGTVTVLIGPSGSGKTTVLRSLNGLEVPDGGLVRIGDVTVDFTDRAPQWHQRRAGRQELARLRSRSGMVFQGNNLFGHLTVLGNVIEGPVQVQKMPKDQAIAEAEALLTQVGLLEKRDAYPYQLSGGQQQRVGIARALALRPELMLFDEPTSALDPELVGEVLTVMKDLAAAGRTMVVVTHEMTFARNVANQVLFMDGGVVVESGPPSAVIGNPTQDRTRQFLHRVIDPI